MANPTAATTNFIGIDLSGRSLRAVLTGADGGVLDRREAPLARDRVTAQIAETVAALREKSANVEAVGIGIPGLVNRDTDRVLVSSDLPSIVSGDVHAQLKQATGLRVELENDANAAAYGEFKVGIGGNHRNMFYITIGEGIGGALIVNGGLWIGASGCAGEIGHITIDTEGIECICGNRGCLETVASAPNIVRRAKERLNRDSTSSLSRLAMKEAFTADDMAREATNGDDFSAMMIERTGKYIGTAVASVINLLSIELVVLGGGVMEAGEIILKPIIDEARRRAFQPCFDAASIVAATLGPDAVAIGAALLARDAGQKLSQGQT
ncbi:MAG: glucokinase [Blastocatellia bacterium]|jgi:glucokinase|nr:glucokinase [Blastocatellia bacterium]